MSSNSTDGLVVLGLHVEDVKRVKVVDITPPATGPVKVRGKNRSGKSSAIGSIALAISNDELPEQPIRAGAKEGSITLRLGAGLDEKYIVKKTFTAKGTYLAVMAKHDGQTMKMASPQRFLEDLRGSGITFDPREFCAAKPSAQVEMLLSVLSLHEDPRTLDTERAASYAERTKVNREAVQAKALLDAELAKQLPEAPDDEVSVAALVAEMERRQSEVSANAALRQHTDRAHETLRCVQRDGTAKINAIEHANATILERIVQLQVELAQGERALQATRVGYNEMIAKAQRAADAAAQATEGLTDPDVAAVRAQIQSAEHLNRQVRVRQAAVRQRTTLQERYDAVAATSAHLTSQIEAIDQRKVDLYATAAFPIEGLAVAQDPKGAYYLTYHDIPISQCSASEQTEIGLSIAGALNPRLKVILIREASLMDEETHARVNAWAEKRGFQVWLEIVSESGDGFVMEEGELKADKQGSLL